MSEQLPTELTLSDVAEFHQQLIRLQTAGLPMVLDSSRVAEDHLPTRLNAIMASLAAQDGTGKPLGQVVQESSVLPDRYRLALQTWHRCDRSTEALSILRTPVQQAAEHAADLRFALLIPLVVLTLVYCASFYLLLVTVPRMEAIYLQLNSPPSLPLRCLKLVRDAMPFWVPALPLAVLIFWALLATGRVALPAWLPSRRRSLHYQSASLASRNLAAQLGCEHAVASNAPMDISDAALRWIPGRIPSPMLSWAMARPRDATTEDPLAINQQQSHRLGLVANLFERMQVIHVQRSRTLLVLLTCIVLGGGLALMYALALFLPLIQVLKDILGK